MWMLCKRNFLGGPLANFSPQVSAQFAVTEILVFSVFALLKVSSQSAAVFF
jgi:hypothetical protein